MTNTPIEMTVAMATIKLLDKQGHVALEWYPEDCRFTMITREVMEALTAKHNELIDLRKEIAEGRNHLDTTPASDPDLRQNPRPG